MIDPKDYLEINKESWNDKVGIHVKSDFYKMDKFKRGETSLMPIEIPLLGDISGESVLHLQCHFGQDSLSMARMGAKVTGVDLSDKSIETAKRLNEELGLDAKFINCDVYSTLDHIDQQFDTVFTSYGTIGWLPDINNWAEVVAKSLRSGGRLVFVEFHPVVWMYDDDFTHVKYKYSKDEPIIEELEGTYADTGSGLKTHNVSWNHGIGEVVNALLQHGMELIDLQEYDYSPYDAMKHMVKIDENKYRISKFGDKIPYVYSLVMTKS